MKSGANNPPAQALATPARRCPVSSVTLPKFFLQRINLVTHPETQQPWLVPQDLDKKEPKSATATATAENEPRSGPADATANKTGPSSYILSRQTLLQELGRPKSQYFCGQRRLMRQSGSHLGTVLGVAAWHSDMDVVLLELMRRRIVDSLLHFAEMVTKEDRKYLVRCERWDDAKELNHRGCLLFLGRGEGASSESGSEYEPPRLSTMDIEGVRFGGKLAVHDLRVLLGETHMSRLRRESELLRGGSLFLLGRQATVNLQMSLWKLQGYMDWGEQSDISPVDSPAEQSQEPSSGNEV